MQMREEARRARAEGRQQDPTNPNIQEDNPYIKGFEARFNQYIRQMQAREEAAVVRQQTERTLPTAIMSTSTPAEISSASVSQEHLVNTTTPENHQSPLL
jgi:hypothetical protein